MPNKFQHVSIGNRKVRLSNLDKILYPEAQISKAEFIQYYVQMAPVILRHLGGRPLSLRRYPDGVDGKQFFQKSRPDWAPEWFESVELGSESKTDYLLATEPAALAWTANLACLELHTMQVQSPNFDKPDHFVFDLDPPDGMGFQDIVAIALLLRTHLEAYGYQVFVKTSGSRGIHLLTRIVPAWTVDEVYSSVKSLAEKFIKKHPNLCTLNMSKKARKGRLLLDIYRNHRSQTTVATYSTRARAGGTVSMPVTWEQLETLQGPGEFTLRTVPDIVAEHGDVMEKFADSAVELHDKKTSTVVDERLKRYTKKRDFDKTTEPPAIATSGSSNRFVIQRHDASHLHYDLRLEDNGVLRSWALPKGLPIDKGVKRLAIETEPHPLSYLSFEGKIPKGEYGAGTMTVFEGGHYEASKNTDKSLRFTLEGKRLKGEFSLYRTDKKQWLLERKDAPAVLFNQKPPKPMLVGSRKTLPTDDGYIYEVKWDGIRTMLVIHDEKIKIYSRSQRELTERFPEMHDFKEALSCHNAILDCEIVCLDDEGKPDFKNVISRMHTSGETKILRASKSKPVVAYVFDCLYLDGVYLHREPLWKRQRLLNLVLAKQGVFRVSEAIDDGEGLFKAAKLAGLEGVIAKVKNSRYEFGKRSSDWYKIKHRQTIDCQVLGYTEGQGGRSKQFGSLHLAELIEGALVYRGRVGTGFDSAKMDEILALIEPLKSTTKPISDKVDDEKQTTWVEPKICVELEYASMTDNGTLREPVFLRLKEDI